MSYNRHGLSKHPLYEVWSSIKKRCYNKNAKCYHRYGGRGIFMCEEWKNDFKMFYDWAINNGYQTGLEIERKNNNKGYWPRNCKWITHYEQMSNTNQNRFITYNNKTQTVMQWSRETGIGESTIRQRLDDYKWSIEKTLTTPARNIDISKILFNNKEQSLSDWCKELNLNYFAIWNRLAKGWSIEKTLTTIVRKKKKNYAS